MSRHSRVLCPGCGKRRRIRPQLLGRTVVCKKCSTRFLASPIPDEPGARPEFVAASREYSGVRGPGSAVVDRAAPRAGRRSAVEETGESLAEMQTRLDLAEESIRGLVDKVRVYKKMASKYGRSRAELLDAEAEMAVLRAGLEGQLALADQAVSLTESLAGDLDAARLQVDLLQERVEGLEADLRAGADEAARLGGLVAELERSGHERVQALEDQARSLDELVRAYEEAMAKERAGLEAERASHASSLADQRDQAEAESGRLRAERDALGREIDAERLARTEAEARAARLAEERDRLASEVAAARASAGEAEAARRYDEGLEARFRELEDALATARARASEADSLRGRLDDAIREGEARRAEFEQFRTRADHSLASLRDQANQKIGDLHRRLQDASDRMKRLTRELHAALLLKESMQASLQAAVEAGLVSDLPEPRPAQAASLLRPVFREKPDTPMTRVELESESEWVRTLVDDVAVPTIAHEGPRPPDRPGE